MKSEEIKKAVKDTVDWICENGPVVRDGITERAIEERLWKLLENQNEGMKSAK